MFQFPFLELLPEHNILLHNSLEILASGLHFLDELAHSLHLLAFPGRFLHLGMDLGETVFCLLNFLHFFLLLLGQNELVQGHQFPICCELPFHQLLLGQLIGFLGQDALLLLFFRLLS